MTKGLLVFVALMLVNVADSDRSIRLDPSQFIVRIEKSQIDLSPNGVTSSDCILVRRDGQFHREHRWQKLPSPVATLRSYDSTLASKDLDQLRKILDDERIKTLSPFSDFGVTGSIAFRKGFQVDISRGTEVQSVGYMEWIESSDSSQSDREALRETQLNAQKHLQPLVEWFSEIASQKLPLSHVRSTLCGLDR